MGLFDSRKKETKKKLNDLKSAFESAEAEYRKAREATDGARAKAEAAAEALERFCAGHGIPDAPSVDEQRRKAEADLEETEEEVTV